MVNYVGKDYIFSTYPSAFFYVVLLLIRLTNLLASGLLASS